MADIASAKAQEAWQRDKQFDHFHLKREWYGSMTLMTGWAFASRDAAWVEWKHAGHYVVIGCDRAECAPEYN